MKFTSTALAAGVWLAALAPCLAAAPAERYFLVSVTGFSGEDEQKVMSATEYKALQEAIRKETHVFQRALMAADKAWRADASHERTMFPRSAISPRRASSAGSGYADMAAAQKKLDTILANDAERAKREAEKKKQEEQLEKQRKKAGGYAGNSNNDAKKQTQAAERKARDAEAVALFESKLNEALAAAETKPATGGVPAADGAAPADGADPAEDAPANKAVERALNR